MGKREEQRKLKLCVLSKIKSKKSILFGKFSSCLTKQDKAKAWFEIGLYAKSVGVVDENKDWSYVRDVWWPNARKSSLEKVDNSKKTGSGGGKDNTLNEVDDEVLDIIGNDSPSIQGLDVPESLQPESSLELELNEISTPPDDSGDFPPPIPSLPRPRTTPHQISSGEADPYTHQKKVLQVDLLKGQIYKTILECRKLEIELGLPQSSLTEKLGDVEIDYVVCDSA